MTDPSAADVLDASSELLSAAYFALIVSVLVATNISVTGDDILAILEKMCRHITNPSDPHALTQAALMGIREWRER